MIRPLLTFYVDTSLDFAKNYNSLQLVNVFIAPARTACTKNERKNKLYQIKRMRQKLQYVRSVSLAQWCACAVAWLVHVHENLIKLRNSISCLFYDVHILHETRFEHMQLSVFIFP